jgi:signal transduction histidine kinase
MTFEEKIRILVVDDEKSIRHVLSQALSQDGNEITVAASGEEAWEIFKKTPFSLVITDIVMQGMTGIELLQKIKQALPDTQVIIMTSYASLDTAVTALRYGAYDYIFKPFEGLDILTAMVTRAIEKIQLLSKNQQLIEQLKKKSVELEKRVEERTIELAKKNEQLKQEIDERKRTEVDLQDAKEAAESASRAKSHFLANMSHELRTPLNHILGFTQILAEKNIGDLNKVQEKYLNNVFKSSKQLFSLINDILDLSKLKSSQINLELSEVNLKELFKNSLKMFKKKALRHNIKLSANIEESPETIMADKRKLKQIIYNLLSNALKFTSDGGKVDLISRKVVGKVRLGLRKEDPENLKIFVGNVNKSEDSVQNYKNCLEFAVTDTGIGIEPEDLKRVLNRFEQIDGSTSRKYKGTGLGLSLTLALVEMHGGKIWAESKGKDQGSTFRFIIPV